VKKEILNQKNSIKNVICFTNSPWSSAVVEVRLKAPLQACGYHLIRGNDSGTLLVKDLSTAHFIVVQRDFPRYVDHFFYILRECRKYNIPLIYEIDDLLFDLPEDHPDQRLGYYTYGLMPILTAISKSDLVTTSTEPLADILRSFNPNVHVLQNYLIDSYWKLKSPKEIENSQGKITIGYIGTGTHSADLEMIQSALEVVVRKYGSKIRLKFIGIYPPNRLSAYSDVQWLPEINSYYEFAQHVSKDDFDILIAPLVSSQFSDCKSPLKYLEYSSLGSPAIYSKTLPYEALIRQGENGFLASSTDEWVYYLEQLIESPVLRSKIATNAQETVRQEWMLSQHAQEWADLYNQTSPTKNITLNTIENQEVIVEKVLKQQISRGEEVIALNKQVMVLTELAKEWADIKSSRSWKIYVRLIKPILRLFPPNSPQIKLFDLAWKGIREVQTNGIKPFVLKATPYVKSAFWKVFKRRRVSPRKSTELYIHVEPVSLPAGIVPRDCLIDIVICVHNALEDIRRCLESIDKFTNPPFRLILVDDGSSEPTQEYLEDYAHEKTDCLLLRNEEAGGYTRAANRGLRSSTAEFIVLLNSDTIVGPEWLDRMYSAIISNDECGVVGPLSNTASWQSIPKLDVNGDWADNPLPIGTSAEKMSRHIAQYSGMTRPEAKLLNGFCLMIKRATINDIGYFDEEYFGTGYGEEDDFNLRARNAGWKLMIADDVYIYHSQSKSYSHERRHLLSQYAGEKLREKHGPEIISESVKHMNPNRIMEGIRARSEVLTDRNRFLDRGRNEFAGKKVLFVLPIVDAGGGGNVVVDEARCMQKMGVDVAIFNLLEHREDFLDRYPHLDIPVIFGGKDSLVHTSYTYNAIIATANYTVEWLKPVWEKNKKVNLGYYVQGFEVLMYTDGTKDAQRALASYSLISDMKLFAKTDWVRNTVLKHSGVNSENIGISVNTDLFRPRHTRQFGEKPVVIVAMVRLRSPYRNPKLTMNVLRRIERNYKSDVDIRLFGADDIRDPGLDVPTDFNWTQAGKLTQHQVANLLSDADIFVDLSSHQAMGLTALEAMACGCTVIVPQNGGATEFVRNRENGLVADTTRQESCYNVLKLAIENDEIRKKMQLTAIKKVAQFYPEAASYKILKCLFNE